jgi:hypothetical protein
MNVRFTAIVLCAFAAVGAGQEAKTASSTVEGPTAPPEIDTALRKRISHFYQAHVDGKFRVADQVVAEDSKDFFFAAPKRKYVNYEIVRINYKDDFKKAEAVVACTGDWVARGQRMKVKLVTSSLWKVEDGQWFWYVNAAQGPIASPFGTMHANAGKTETPPADEQSKQAAAAVLRDPGAAAALILQSVRADKSELTLKGYENSSGEVAITNGMQGPVTLRADIDGKFAGLTFSLDKTEVPAGETAKLRIVCEPKDKTPKPTLTALIFVEQTGQTIPIRLFFAVPPEVEKQIPKELRRPGN